VAVSLISAAPAWAQTSEQKAGARAAAEAGADAFDAGKYAEAADLFERAERLMHAPPHLLHAARSHVKLGHLVEARELYLTLSREQLPASAPRAFRDAVKMGEKELAELEPRLAYVSLVVQGGGGASALRVTRNGEAVPAELVGVPTPVNPGEYSYQAFAEGMESTATTIKMLEGGRETVVLTLRTLPGGANKKAASSRASDAGSSGAGSLTSEQPSDTAPGSAGGRPLLVGSIVGFGVAVAGGVVGTIFMINSGENLDRSDALYNRCVPVGCTTEEKRQISAFDDDATFQQGIAVTGFVAAGLGLATGVTLLILDQNRSVAPSATNVTPVVGMNYVGVAGRF
jgi:hypothetical protein